jgi:hypothetical protein
MILREAGRRFRRVLFVSPLLDPARGSWSGPTKGVGGRTKGWEVEVESLLLRLLDLDFVEEEEEGDRGWEWLGGVGSVSFLTGGKGSLGLGFSSHSFSLGTTGVVYGFRAGIESS